MASHVIYPYDCIDSMLHLMDEKSVHCVVTSPPYFGLRDYGHEGQIGLEETPDAYVAKMVQVFRAVRRVLRDDGTVWLNLGDSYARAPARGGSGPGGKNIAYSDSYGNAARVRSESNGSSDGVTGRGDRAPIRTAAPGLADKQLLGIPWRVAFALQADGWYLRQEIIWHKPNPMPESVRDRCTKAHEQIFLLTKSPRYFFDAEAIKEDAIYAGKRDSVPQGGFGGKGPIPGSGQASFRSTPAKRNKRSVWTVAPQPFKGAHFATFPPALIEPCILAGSPVGGTVLDPFGGSGTTAAVAIRHGRNAVLCEINPEYIGLAEQRIAAA